MGRTLFEKIWDAHVVADLGGGMELLHVDRHVLSDLGGARGLTDLARRNLRVRNPELTFATPDHVVSTEPGRSGGARDWAVRMIDTLRTEARNHAIRVFDIPEGMQGIVHVIGPELGLTLPGALVVCADSHTCTNGGVGAMGFGIGSSELLHVLATQTIVQKRPKTLRVRFTGRLPAALGAKDLALALIARLGASGGSGYAIEYAGDAVCALGAEARMTLCNLSIELAAKIGMVAPDETAFEYLHGRPYAPRGKLWERALEHWKTLPSDAEARFDREAGLDCAALAPQITWGTSMEHVIPIDGAIPDPEREPDAGRREMQRAAIDYMGLVPGRPIAGTPIDRVFIGSCTNARLSDLRSAASIVRGRKIAPRVRAWVVPGSMKIRRDAEAQGLHRVFLEAGFEWREPGCSMCLGANEEVVEPHARCVSTSNRNFVGRQVCASSSNRNFKGRQGSPSGRTLLMSPAMVAAAAVAGEVVDVRGFPTPAGAVR